MNHGNDDDDEESMFFGGPQRAQPAPSRLLNQLMGGMGMGMGMGHMLGHFPPTAFDEYYKAYSVAVMPGKERPELMYGGKIVMPPSALARLSALDIQGPWTFQLRNPRNPSVHRTHAGVLEFIAEESNVYLPAWMMKTLGLTEGDSLRINGAALPKGKMVKIQAQSVDFLQVSDAKAVLESALRFYSVLTKGDIIEITYNSLVFEFLIMETAPEGAGISVIDTDLEVDFATPVGYVEPPRPAPAPIPTMADKLKINLNETTPASASSSRPASVASVRQNGSGDTTPMESFTGYGQSLSGRRVKGKGLSKKIEEVEGSRVSRNDGPKIITPDSLHDADRQVPVALVLPPGKFFFGYKYIPFDPNKVVKKAVDITPSQPFGGDGQTLRPGRNTSNQPASTTAGTGITNGTHSEEKSSDPWANLGSGNSLRRSDPAPPSSTTRTAAPPDIIDATMLDEDDFTFGEEYVDDDEDDIIEIDSD